MEKLIKMRIFKQTLIIILLLLSGWLVYQNGLNGGFIFDDENNIGRLSTIDNNLSYESIKSYFGQSTSGPLKRPISVFSFLIDGQDWPIDAYPFKRTNLIIHLINGALLYFVLLSIFRNKGFVSNKQLYIAGVSTTLWLLHPFLVSTTLYVVQRMAMLPLTFMLIGFIIYIRGRYKYELSQGNKGSVQLFVAVYGMTVLAMLSKENGIVFLWLVALFEVFIIQWYLRFSPLNKNLSLWLLKLPGLALFFVFVLQLPGFIEDYDLRIFNMYERVLTQFRAISKYLYHIFIPSYFTEGVFIDGFKYSNSLFEPITTLFSVIFIIGLLYIAWIKRTKWVWISFATFFFFIAQVLESTIVPLELYFEHRVYVASIFLFVPIVLAFIKLSDQSKIYLIVPLLLCVLLGLFTYMRSDIWSNNLQLHELSMKKYPDSVRGQMMTAKLYDTLGLHDDVRRIINKGAKNYKSLQIKFNKAALQCYSGNLNSEDINTLIKQVNSTLFIKNDHLPFVNLTELLLKHRCLDDLTLDTVYRLADAVENNSNKKLKAKNAAALFTKARVFLELGEYKKATTYFLKSFEISVNDYESINSALVLILSKQQYHYAQVILNYEKRIYENEFKYKIDWLNISETIEGFQELIDKNINEQNSINYNSGKK